MRRSICSGGAARRRLGAHAHARRAARSAGGIALGVRGAGAQVLASGSVGRRRRAHLGASSRAQRRQRHALRHASRIWKQYAIRSAKQWQMSPACVVLRQLLRCWQRRSPQRVCRASSRRVALEECRQPHRLHDAHVSVRRPILAQIWSRRLAPVWISVRIPA